MTIHRTLRFMPAAVVVSQELLRLAKEAALHASMRRPVLHVVLAEGQAWSRGADGELVWHEIGESAWDVSLKDCAQLDPDLAACIEESSLLFPGLNVWSYAELARGTVIVDARDGAFVVRHSLEGPRDLIAAGFIPPEARLPSRPPPGRDEPPAAGEVPHEPRRPPGHLPGQAAIAEEVEEQRFEHAAYSGSPT